MRRSLPESRNFLAIPRSVSAYSTSAIAIVSAPYEHSVSYGSGTGKGPAAILDASHYVEFWDEELKRELCFEKGIATLPPLQFGKKRNEAAVSLIYKEVASVLADDKFCVTIGGEHTISAAPIRAHFERFPGMSVLQFDAHSDLRVEYQGNPFSHASVMARVSEFFPPERIVQLGIRAQCREEAEFIRDRGVKTFYAREVRNGTHGSDWMGKIIRSLTDAVYITFDVDYFDPSVMPGTGTPEPGGFFWDETIELLMRISAVKRIVGFDIVELAPMETQPHAAYLAAKLLYKILNIAFYPASPRKRRLH